MTESFYKEMKFGSIKVVQFRHFSLKYMYQARKVRGHVYVYALWLSDLLIFLRIFYWILELIRQRGIFFHFMIMFPSVWFKRICLAF
jgi:hypothetical protein